MKSIKLFATLALLCSVFLAKSQVRISTLPNMQQGAFIDFGGVNLIPSDSLQVSDSIAYIVPITHQSNIFPYITWLWTKIGAGTATVTLSFLQGNDPANLFPVKAGVNQTTYTKTYTLSAAGTTPNEVDFQRDTAQFVGRYLKVYFITSSTASVKGKLFVRLKTVVK